MRLVVSVFRNRTTAVMIHAPDGYSGTVEVPVLKAPFSAETLRAEFSEAGIEAVVSEASVGVMRQAMLDARSAERGARGEEARRNAALNAQIQLGSVDARERDRAKVVLRLNALEAELAEVKRKIVAAIRRRAETGHYIARSEFLALQEREAKINEEKIAIQAQLRQLAKVRQETFERRFVDAAKALLDDETWRTLLDLAQEPESGENAA